MIILSLLAFALETLPRLTSGQRQQLRLFEIASVVVFTVEYLVRAALARRPRAYLLSFFGIIDLLAILPFYLSLGVDLRALRAFRLLRLFRILKLARYSAADGAASGTARPAPHAFMPGVRKAERHRDNSASPTRLASSNAIRSSQTCSRSSLASQRHWH